MQVVHNIQPIYDKNSNILLLGSMPSIVSRNEKFYYANNNNRFWLIINSLFNTKLITKEEKISFLMVKRIAMWDVIKKCDINASNDASIKNIEVNNIHKIINKSKIKAIFCLGRLAYNIIKKNINFSIPVIYLPSPSSANASWSTKDLINNYKIILDYIKKD